MEVDWDHFHVTYTLCNVRVFRCFYSGTIHLVYSALENLNKMFNMKLI